MLDIVSSSLLYLFLFGGRWGWGGVGVAVVVMVEVVCVCGGGGVYFVETSWVPACRDSGSRTRCRLCYRVCYFCRDAGFVIDCLCCFSHDGGLVIDCLCSFCHQHRCPDPHRHHTHLLRCKAAGNTDNDDSDNDS